MKTPPVSVASIFRVFLKIGTASFGGVYSMLALFERELVRKRRWLTAEEFAQAVAIGQLTPGPPIVNTGLCIGYRLAKVRGAVAATLGQVGPGTGLAVLLAVWYLSTDNALLRAILKGVGAAVVGLLLAVVYKLATKTLRTYPAAALALAAFLAMAVLHLNPIGVLLAAGAAGLLLGRGAVR